MGSHPSNPSKDLATGRTLLDLFDANQALLSHSITEKYGAKLPFLFKVLSIQKALSIQAHPNKALAEQLHARDPKNYPDDNHKPEMAIAITPFEGLCGFRPLNEIAHFLETIPPLSNVVGSSASESFVNFVKTNPSISEDGLATAKLALKDVFSALMSSKSSMDTECAALAALAKSEGDNFAGGGVTSTPGATLAELVTRLYGEFGADIGIFVLFFLNFITLEPGEALFLKADDVHAYVSGDIMECMAASDNVVRAGLTPKFKDVSTLVDMLTYSFAPIDEQKMEATDYPYATLNRAAYSAGSLVQLYDPPIDEFSVIRTVLRGDCSKATFEPLDGPSIIICTAGKGKVSVGPTVQDIREGYVFFVGATAELSLLSDIGEDDEFITFKAFCEVDSRTLTGDINE
jgi:mannose-6-phosphate isomerase